ncbi:MAG TPA: hypothetical protein VFE77_06125 [Rhodanobacter sp.]|nr:hypothetical protein [Rhodanobacter sp.]
MKRYLACVIAATLLSGCSSAGTLRNTAPTAVYVGDNTAEAVATCISNAWSAKQLQMTTVPVFGGTSIQLQESADGPIVALVDITPTGSHTTAKYYSRFSYDDTWFFKQVQNCMT